MSSKSSESMQWMYRDMNLDGVEDVERYTVGGYHPVNIGDILGEKENQYEVIHKLGSGGFSTVWLAGLVNNKQQRYYALKILCANATDDNDMELNILRYLQKCAAPHPNISSLDDVFQINGPNGLHYCLVLPVLGPSIKDMSGRQLPKSLRQKACQQIASGLAYLHSLEICHGDLTYSNVLFELQDIQSWSKIQIYEHLGPVKTAPLKLLDGSYSPHAPKRVVQAVNFSNIGPKSLGNIRIIDFGQSFFAKNPPDDLGTSPSFFAPEICFGFPPSKNSDIWALACLIFEIQSSRMLFPMVFDNVYIMLGTIAGVLGPFPATWEHAFTCRDQTEYDPVLWWYDESFQPSRPLASLVNKHSPHLLPSQQETFLKLLQGVLAYEPTQRLSAKDITSYPWFSECSPEVSSGNGSNNIEL
ncbi:hypothetical protein B7494_g391 [Chlorociboria aeruginascens]|nr:hypothetical protein B7494_g391 [Chlorociboria aeruginascens]